MSVTPGLADYLFNVIEEVDDVTSLASIPIVIGDLDVGASLAAYGQLSIKFDETTDVVRLIKIFTVGLSNDTTLVYADDDSVIEAPVGKKLECAFLWKNISTIAASSFNVRASDTQDTADGTILQSLQNLGLNGQGSNTKVLAVPAGKFLTIENLSASAAVGIVYGIAIEKDE